jgi:hypothetical protein
MAALRFIGTVPIMGSAVFCREGNLRKQNQVAHQQAKE